MIRKFLCSRLFVFFVGMFLLGFFIGYDYAVITSREPQTASSNVPAVRASEPEPAGDMEEESPLYRSAP